MYQDGEEETGTYSLVIDDKKDAAIRINAEMDSEKFSLILTGDTLKIIPPPDSGLEFALLANRINEADAKRRLALAADAEEVETREEAEE